MYSEFLCKQVARIVMFLIYCDLIIETCVVSKDMSHSVFSDIHSLLCYLCIVIKYPICE